jgi:hypothetical protein
MKLLQGWLAGVLATLAACGTARVIQKMPTNGVIELQGDHNKAMEQANEEMAMHCGAGNFTVLSEGYEAVSPDAGSAAAPAAPPAAPPTGPTAWRIRYQCDAAPVGSVVPSTSPSS